MTPVPESPPGTGVSFFLEACMKKGRLNFSKTVKILPGVRLRYNLRSGITLTLGVGGLSYSLPLGNPKFLQKKENKIGKITSGNDEPEGD